MKARLLLMALAAALPSLGRAQDADDMYFAPKKKSRQTTTATQARPVFTEPDQRLDDDTVACYTGQLRDVDEYNRRPSASASGETDVVVIDTLGMQWVLTKTETGDYVWLPAEDEEEVSEDAASNSYTDGDDYSCSSRLVRFHGYVSPYGALWIDPWYYDSWYYDPWYGWYSPWYGWGWGLSWGIGWGWYGWYGPGWHGGWWPHAGFAYGGRRGSTFGHIRGGALASSGRGGSRINNRTTASRGTTATRGNTVSRSTATQRSTRSNVSRSTGSLRSTGTSRSVGTSRSSGFSGGSSRGSFGGGFSGGGSRGGGFGGGGSRGGGGRR